MNNKLVARIQGKDGMKLPIS